MDTKNVDYRPNCCFIPLERDLALGLRGFFFAKILLSHRLAVTSA